MKYILGIDQGGSKTHAIVMDSTGMVLGLGVSYGACHSSSGIDYAMEAVEDAVAQALQQGGLTLADISGVGAGMTGVDWSYEEEQLRTELSSRFGIAQTTVVNDCIIAMRAATTKEQCGIICAGTGLNCAVKNGNEQFIYGFYIADEYQGGASLARTTIQAVIDSHLGLCGPTALTQQVLNQLQYQSVDELLYNRVLRRIPAEANYQLPLLLEEAALAGDEVAMQIWLDYARVLARYLTTRMEKMNILEAEADIVLSGSILKCKIPRFQQRLRQEILAKAPNVTLMEATYEPIVGAGLLALDAIEDRASQQVIQQNLLQSAQSFPLCRMSAQHRPVPTRSAAVQL